MFWSAPHAVRLSLSPHNLLEILAHDFSQHKHSRNTQICGALVTINTVSLLAQSTTSLFACISTTLHPPHENILKT